MKFLEIYGNNMIKIRKDRPTNYCVTAAAALIIGLSGVASAQSDEPDAPSMGKALATTMCVSCHGADGKSIGPLWPNLAGQRSQYMVKQLQDFKSGKRSDLMMGPIAKNLTDDSMLALADYFESMEP